MTQPTQVDSSTSRPRTDAAGVVLGFGAALDCELRWDAKVLSDLAALYDVAPEELAVGAGLDQPVREHAGDRAGRKRHGGLAEAALEAHADRRRGGRRDRVEALGTEHDRRGVARAGPGE